MLLRFVEIVASCGQFSGVEGEVLGLTLSGIHTSGRRRFEHSWNPHPNVAQNATLGWGTRHLLGKAFERRGRGELPRRTQRKAWNQPSTRSGTAASLVRLTP